MKIIGARTLTFGLASLCVMLAGFWMLPADARGEAFVFFASGIGALMAAVAGKSSVDSLAGGGGIAGAKAALMTSAKPEAPPDPPVAP
jgi:hypothetical protein